MSRFVRPETTTLHISQGDTLIVKRRLTAGEHRDMLVRGSVMGEDEKLHVNPAQIGLAAMTAFLVDWSFVDDRGQHVEIRGLSIADLEACLRALDPDDFEEVKTAIEAHENAMTAERDQEKKHQAGASGSVSTSPSLVGAV